MAYRLILLVAIVLLGSASAAVAIEEPAYKVLQKTEDYEIRQYEAFIVAEVDVAGDAGNSAFRILADYIFGNNAASEKMQMTAPVVSVAPTEGDGKSTYAFVMESRYSLDTLPAPVDPRIRIVAKPAQVIAARQYSGRWTEQNYRENETALVSSLESDGVATAGDAYLARYDDPFTPWFLRRNEVLIEVDWE